MDGFYFTLNVFLKACQLRNYVLGGECIMGNLSSFGRFQNDLWQSGVGKLFKETLVFGILHPVMGLYWFLSLSLHTLRSFVLSDDK